MRYHDQCSFPRKVCSAVAFLCLGSSFLLTAAAQESPKPPVPSSQRIEDRSTTLSFSLITLRWRGLTKRTPARPLHNSLSKMRLAIG
jgi:hypothetical protein